MELCPMCKRIVSIRLKQKKSYFQDLCYDCRKKVLAASLKSMEKVAGAGGTK